MLAGPSNVQDCVPRHLYLFENAGLHKVALLTAQAHYLWKILIHKTSNAVGLLACQSSGHGSTESYEAGVGARKIEPCCSITRD